MTQQSLHYKTLSEVAARIAEGNLDSVGVTEALLERIEALEPKLHSYITVLGEQALARARAADTLRDQGKALGVLHGVPIAVKDLCHKRGYPTTGGHSFRKELISDSDATVVARLEAAGAIILGKLATTEGAMVGYHRDFQVPRNPWGARCARTRARAGNREARHPQSPPRPRRGGSHRPRDSQLARCSPRGHQC